MNTLRFVSVVLVLAGGVVTSVSAQQVEFHNRERGELSPNARAPSRAAMVDIVTSGSPGQIERFLEYGQMVKCYECIPAIQRRLLDEPSGRVREMLAWYARNLDLGRGVIIEQLADTIESSANAVHRARAAEALGEMMEPMMRTRLQTAATGDADATVRASAVRALGRLNHPAGIPTLVEAMRDTDRGVRLAAVTQVRFVNFFRSYDALAGLLADSDGDVRREAALALAMFGAEARSAAIPLAGLLRSDPDANVRQAAAYALGRIGGAEARAALNETLTSEASSLVRDAIEVARRM